MKRALLLLLFAGCDPIWRARVTLHDPSNQPVPQATLTLDCSHSETFKRLHAVKATSDAKGVGDLVGSGTAFPDCDVVVTKPGFQPVTIAYRDLCPNGPKGCQRVFERALVLQPTAP